MSRSNRGIILALVGWLVLAASPPQQQRGQQDQQSSNAIADSLENVAAAIDRGNERQGYNPDCEPGSDNRRSDLCAQWKAADAASESASWASWFWWLSIVGTVIGASTLGAAAAAAIFAKKAAEHTETGAKEGKRAADAAEKGVQHSIESSQMALRAYISSESECFEEDGQGGLFLSILLRNCGDTPARDVFIDTSGTVENSRGTAVDTVMFGRTTPGMLGPGVTFGHRIEFRNEKGVFDNIRDKDWSYRLLVCTHYSDVFGLRWVHEHWMLGTALSLKTGTFFTISCEVNPDADEKATARKRRKKPKARAATKKAAQRRG